MTAITSPLESREHPPLQAVPDLTQEHLDQELQFTADQIALAKERTALADTFEYAELESHDKGFIERYGYIDNAGYARAAVVGIPNAVDATTVPVIFTWAWFTSTEGHNLHTGLRFLEAGVPFIMSGAEGSYRPGWRQLRPPRNGINLTDSALSLLALSAHVAEQHPLYIHPTDREVIGESRGGMVGMGVVALAEALDQNIVMADLTAPCFPRGLSRDDVGEFSQQVRSEPKTAIGLASKITRRLLWHYPQTLDPHPIGLLHQLGIWPALQSGEAGDLGRLTSDDQIMHVTCFNDDYASMPDVWREVLRVDGSTSKRITLLEGSHLTIADPQTLEYILARNKAYRILTSHPSRPPSGQEIFDYAHQLVPEQFRSDSAE